MVAGEGRYTRLGREVRVRGERREVQDRWRTNLLHFGQLESLAHILQHVGSGGDSLQHKGGKGRDSGWSLAISHCARLTLFSLCSKP